MKIDNKTLSEFICGAVRFETIDGYLFPRRFTEKQSENLRKNEFLDVRSRYSASIMLDFETDSRKISFEAYFLFSTRECFSFDVYINEVLEYHFSGNGCKFGDKRKIEFNLPGGTNRVRIYFPCLFETGISEFSIDNNAFIVSTKKDKSFLFLGDSITNGQLSKFSSYTYVNILSHSFNANTLNQAICGDMFNASHIEENLPFTPDTIIVAYGTNDWWHGRNVSVIVKEYFDKLTSIYPQVPIFALLPIYRLDAEESHREVKIPFMDFREQMKECISEYHNVTVIDTINFVPHFADFYEDGYLHPNDMGYMKYAEHLKEYIC